MYRELALRANYFVQDRCDIQFAIKDICRGMGSPTKFDVEKLRRLGRYDPSAACSLGVRVAD